MKLINGIIHTSFLDVLLGYSWRVITDTFILEMAIEAIKRMVTDKQACLSSQLTGYQVPSFMQAVQNFGANYGICKLAQARETYVCNQSNFVI